MAGWSRQRGTWRRKFATTVPSYSSLFWIKRINSCTNDDFSKGLIQGFLFLFFDTLIYPAGSKNNTYVSIFFIREHARHYGSIIHVYYVDWRRNSDIHVRKVADIFTAVWAARQLFWPVCYRVCKRRLYTLSYTINCIKIYINAYKYIL